MTERQERILRVLKKQDEILLAIFKQREQIAENCREHGDYNEINEMLYLDKKSHCSF